MYTARYCLWGTFWLVVVIAPLLYAQEQPQIVTDILEQIEDDRLNEADWLEHLWELRENPLDINRAKTLDLMRIPFVPPSVAKEIVRYRRKHGAFREVRELLQVPGMSEELLQALEPLIQVKPKERRKEFLLTRTNIYFGYPLKEGYRKGVYHSPVYFHQRVLLRATDEISVNGILEKDAGEKNWTDFTSFSLSFSPNWANTRILIGDFQIRFGSGLALWSPYGMPLNTSAFIPLPGTRSLFQENRSTSANGFLRGLLVSTRIFSRLSLTAFYSNRYLDATVDSTGEWVLNLRQSELHRTETEIRYRHVLHEELAGAALGFTHAGTISHLYFIKSQYNPAFQKHPHSPSYLGFSFRKEWKTVRLGNEFLLDERQRVSNQTYFSFVQQHFRYMATFYYYHPQIFTPRSRAIGAFGTPAMNRIGFVAQARYRPGAGIHIAGYTHFYRKITGLPEDLFLRQDYCVEAGFRIQRHLFTLQLWRKQRFNKTGIESESEQKIHVGRLNMMFRVTREFNWQTRLELRWAQPLEKTYRYYATNFYVQGNYHQGNRWGIKIRWSAFDVPDYDVRIYENEPDMPGSVRSVVLNGYGYKWFVLLHFRLSSVFQIYLKYHMRNYPNRSSLGSGWDEIPANYARQFRMAIVIKM